MSRAETPCYDVAIVGAGPVGSVCALAHARKGARVALFEGNPNASLRLAGEWLHPPALQILNELGVHLGTQGSSTPGRGFVVFPEDGTEPIQLPYLHAAQGLACEHSVLVSQLRTMIGHVQDIDFFVPVRVRQVEEGQLIYSVNGSEQSVRAERIVGADGRASTVRQSLGLSKRRKACSRMVGMIVEGVDLQLKGFGHVLLGGPGPILMYQMGEQRVRLIVDVPLDHWIPRDRVGVLADSYTRVLPKALRPGFIKLLREGNFQVANNELRPRITYGNSHRVLVGDAAGHYHPMTAVGMTLGFGDAFVLAESKDFDDFVHRRFHEIRAPQLLAMGLYEVFADYRVESAILRHVVYRSWRANSLSHTRTIDLLSCENTSVPYLSFSFSMTVVKAICKEIPRSLSLHAWQRTARIVSALAARLRWLVQGVHALWKARQAGEDSDDLVRDILAGAFLTSIQPSTDESALTRRDEVEAVDAGAVLGEAGKRLLELQREDGAWEGEMVWCPMLTAQYVLLHHIMGCPLEAGRGRRILHHFERTRLKEGAWGLHDHSPPHLFVTTLVYLAMRTLGIDRDDPRVAPARQFMQAEGVTAIPSWGKFWLAVLNLYDWRGVNAILPELYSLPRWVVFHPANWYCHTRLIYMAMSVIYVNRFQAPVTPLTESLREELFPQGYTEVNFSAARDHLRSADLFARPSRWLRAGFALARLYERWHSKRLRTRSVQAILRSIRWELKTTSHTSISPVSGLLNILALWLHDPDDPDCHQAFEQLAGWLWEDEEDGARVTGARSASWDTGFALQALATISKCSDVQDAMRRGTNFLYQQQITSSFEGYRKAYRADPKGGWCFAGGWHGWPVSDCTAEAVLGIVATQGECADAEVLAGAVQFMLRSQNPDGGFGSYEAKRSGMNLEWLNLAEMFGESMTEHSFVECTASCVAALAACQQHIPHIADRSVTGAMDRADAWLRKTQATDGSWRGVWGVQFIYGTLFGIRGLQACGARPGDPALRLACKWLLQRQRDDGGWGEHHSGCLSGHYVAHSKSQVIHSAWALMALLEAADSDWAAIKRGIRYLLDARCADGSWPRQDMAGVFFRTALLDYALYREYFPLHALGLYEQRRRARQDLTDPVIRNTDARPVEAEKASRPEELLRTQA